MTIDEVIAMMHEWADYECYNEEQIQASEAFNQITEWLEELKELRKIKEDYAKGMQTSYATFMYNKAIDDYRTEICKAFVQSERNGNYRFYAVEIKQLIADLKEQLKAGGENVQKK